MQNYFNSQTRGKIVRDNNLDEPFLLEGGQDKDKLKQLVNGDVSEKCSVEDDDEACQKHPNSWTYHNEKIQLYKQVPNYNQRGIFYLDGKEQQYCYSSLFCLEHTSRFRYYLVWLTSRNNFGNFILVVIFINSVMMGAKDYLDTENETPRNQALEKIEPYVNFIIYTECVIKIIAMGFVLGKNSYLRDGWNILDFVVVSASVISTLQAVMNPHHVQTKGVQAFRTFRLLRPLRLIGRIESLRNLIGTLLSSMSSLGATLGLTVFVFTIYAIFGMTVWSGALHFRCYVTPEPVLGEWEMLSGYTDPCSENSPCPSGSYCGNRFEKRDEGVTFNNPNMWIDSDIEELFWGYNNFDNLGSAYLTVFQVTTTDGWTPMMFFYENSGSPVLSWFFFISCVVICNFFILNLTVGQMMLQYEIVQEENEKSNQADDKYDVFTQDLVDFGKKVLPEEYCQEDDKNLLEFIIERDEVVLAESAKEYVQVEKSFFKSFSEGQKQESLDHDDPYYQNQAVELCLAFIEDTYFNAFILFVIIANTLVLCCDKYPAYPPEVVIYFDVANIVFTAIFTAELIIKIIGLGIRPFAKDGFNLFDAVIVFTSIQGIVIELQGEKGANKYLLILRTFRCFRIFKLFKVGDLRVLVDSQLRTLPVFVPYMCLLMFVFYIFALIGMSFFAGKIRFDDDGNYDPNGTTVRENYDTLGQSFLTIFQVLMGAEWRFIWYQNMRSTGSIAALYYFILIICVVIVMINLLMAIMLGNYDKARQMSDKRKIFEAIKMLQQEVNTPEYIVEQGKKGLKAGDKKYDFEKICDIVFGDYSHHIKHNICKIGGVQTEDNQKASKIVNMIKQQLQKTQMEQNFETNKEEEEDLHIMDHHDQQIVDHNYSWFSNSSLGIFHIDSSIRRACLCLAVDNPNYNELQLIRKKINTRNIHAQVEHYHRLLIEGPTEENKPEKIQKNLSSFELYQGFNYNKHFENFVLCLIIINSIQLAFNNPLMDPESSLHKNLYVANIVFTILFTIELVIRIIAHGFFANQLFHIEPYITSGWNQLDFLVVTTSLLDLILELMIMFNYVGKSTNLSAFKSLRALRALRPLRAIKGLPQLKQVVTAFLESFAAIQNVFMVGILMLVIFAVVGVSLFKGKFWQCDLDADQIITQGDCIKEYGEDAWNDSSCGADIITMQDCFNVFGKDAWARNDSNFDDIVQAMRALFILTTTEGWAGLMFLGVDTTGVEMQPKQESSWGSVWYFICFMIVGSLFIANLIVGVIIDQFNKAKQTKVGADDPSNVKVKVHLAMTDIQKEKELKNHVCVEPDNWRKYAFRVTHHPLFDKGIVSVVLLNTLTMSMVLYDSSKEYKDFLSYCNMVFTVIFNIEMILKLIADKLAYFEVNWNIMDMFIVFCADLGVAIQLLGGKSSMMRNAITVFRVLRILRIAKLLQRFDNIQILLDSLILITPNISNILLLLTLVIYIYALIGIYMFAGAKRIAELDKYNNFDTFGRAVLGLVRFSTGEDFQEFMYEYSNTSDCDKNQTYQNYIDNGNNGCGSSMSIPYFFSYIVTTSWMVINLIIAAIIDGLSEAHTERSKLVNKDVIQKYLELWQTYDKDLEWKIEMKDFWFFLADLDEPLGDSLLKQSWNGIDRECGFMYTDEKSQNRFKIRKFNIFNVLKYIDFKITKDGDKYYVKFDDVTPALVTRTYKLDQLNKELIKKLMEDDDNKLDFKARASKGKQLASKVSALAFQSDKAGHHGLEECPKHHLAAMIIQDHFIDKQQKHVNCRTGINRPKIN